MAFRWEVGGSPPNPFPLERGAPSSHTVTSDRVVHQGFSAPRPLREAPEALLLVPLLFLLLGAVPDKVRAQEGRFGDTTWVAPNASAYNGDPAAAGPRVAEPDVERGWEKALRAPFRVVFYPLRLAARGSQAVLTYGSQFINYEPRLIPWLGVRAAPVFGISGTAGPSAGIAIQGRSGLGARAMIMGTWSLKDTRRIRLQAGITEPDVPVGLEVSAAYDYRPNRRFYGIGNETEADGKTIYLRRENVGEASLFVGHNPYRRIRGVVSVSDIDVGPGYRDAPRAQDVYTSEEVPFLTEGSGVVSYGAGGDLALLNDVVQPSLGVHVRGEARRFDGIDETNLHYVSWFGEARAYLPVLASRRVIALRYVYEGVDPRDGSDQVPFYRLPTSTDEVRFAAFRSSRFMDRRLMVAHAEYRWIILPQYTLWAHVFGQLGMVAPTQEGFRLDDAHESIGGGLRAKIGPTTTARLEIASGDEGTRIYLDLKGDF
jgi:hypothetical protein